MGSGPPGYIRTRTHVAALGRAWPQGSTTGPELHRRGAFNTERASDSLISRPRNHPLALPELRPPTRGKLPDRQRGSPRHRVLDLLAHFSLGRLGPPSGGGGVLFHGAASYLINRFKVRSTKPSLDQNRFISLERVLVQSSGQYLTRLRNSGNRPGNRIADSLHRLIAAADLNQHRRLEADPALHIVLDAVAILLRRESGCRPLAGIHTQPRTLDVLVIDDPLAVAGRDVVVARVIRNLTPVTFSFSPSEASRTLVGSEGACHRRVHLVASAFRVAEPTLHRSVRASGNPGWHV